MSMLYSYSLARLRAVWPTNMKVTYWNGMYQDDIRIDGWYLAEYNGVRAWCKGRVEAIMECLKNQ